MSTAGGMSGPARAGAAGAILLAAAHAAVTLISPGSALSRWLIDAALVAAALLCFARAARPGAARRPSLLIGAALLSFAAGDRYYMTVADSDALPVPSWADAGYLGFYPLAALGIIAELRRHVDGWTRDIVLDATIAALAVAFIAAAFVYPGLLDSSGGDTAAVLTTLAYPVADLALLALLVGGAHVLSWRLSRTLTVMALGLGLWVAADTIYLLQMAADTYVVGRPLDALWSSGAVVMALAVWQRSAQPRALRRGRLGLAFVAAAAATAVGVQLLDHYDRVSEPVAYLSGATLLVTVIRMLTAVGAAQRAEEAGHRLAAIVESAEVAIATASPDGRVTSWNRAAERLYGYTREEALGRTVVDLVIPPEFADEAAATIARIMRGEAVTAYETQCVHKDGRRIDVGVSLAAVRNRHGAITGVSAVTQDIGERKRAARALAEAEETLRDVTETIDEVFWVASVDPVRVLYVSPMYAPVFGRPISELYQDPFAWIAAVHPDDRRRVIAALERLGAAPEEVREEYRVVHASGEQRWVRARVYEVEHTGERRRVVGVTQDITAEREARDKLVESENRFRHLALHDPLTGLANRTLFLDRLEHALARRAQEAVPSVVAIDIDNFKAINDALGHQAGDELLVEVGRRIAASVRPEDTVARLGGDEFAVVVSSRSERGLRDLGRRIADALSGHYELVGRIVNCSASVGMAARASAGEDMDSLIGRADLALYEAKSAGGAQCVFYDEAIEASASLRRELAAGFSRGMAATELVVHYQPMCDLASGRIEGFEALVRCRHPVHGLLAPDRFLEIAAEAGASSAIGRFVLGEATRTVASWNAGRADADFVSVHVNLSARELGDPALFGVVEALVSEPGFNPHWLILEVTEQTVVADLAKATATLRALRALGVRIALDDFGTGYSSLGYLRDLPVFSILKLDRRLVSADHPRDRAILQTAVELAHGLAMEIVAEGVETEEQRALLLDLGVLLGQGWLLGRPTDAGAATALLAASPAASKSGPERTPPSADPPSRGTILVIDDHVATLKLLGEQLTRSGFTARLALTAEEGERIALAESPDMVLIDLNMPGADGPETAQLLRSHPELDGLPLIACSATPLSAYREGELSEWFDGELAKTARSSSELGDEIEQLLATAVSSAPSDAAELT